MEEILQKYKTRSVNQEVKKEEENLKRNIET